MAFGTDMHEVRNIDFYKHTLLVGPRQANRCLRTFTKCTDSDSSRACAKPYPGICSALIHSIVSIADIEDRDQTAQNRRLLWAFTVPICPKTHFRMARPSYGRIKPKYNESDHPSADIVCLRVFLMLLFRKILCYCECS